MNRKWLGFLAGICLLFAAGSVCAEGYPVGGMVLRDLPAESAEAGGK